MQQTRHDYGGYYLDTKRQIKETAWDKILHFYTYTFIINIFLLRRRYTRNYLVAENNTFEEMQSICFNIIEKGVISTADCLILYDFQDWRLWSDIHATVIVWQTDRTAHV